MQAQLPNPFYPIINNLTSTCTTAILDASQGKAIYDSLFIKANTNMAADRHITGKYIFTSPLYLIEQNNSNLNLNIGIRFGNDVTSIYGSSKYIGQITINDAFWNIGSGISTASSYSKGTPTFEFSYKNGENPASHTVGTGGQVCYLPPVLDNETTNNTYEIYTTKWRPIADRITYHTVAKYGVTFYARVLDNWCFLYSAGSCSQALSSGATFAQLPSGYRTKIALSLPAISNSADTCSGINIHTNGAIVASHAIAKNTYIYCSTMYFVNV